MAPVQIEFASPGDKDRALMFRRRPPRLSPASYCLPIVVFLHKEPEIQRFLLASTVGRHSPRTPRVYSSGGARLSPSSGFSRLSSDTSQGFIRFLERCSVGVQAGSRGCSVPAEQTCGKQDELFKRIAKHCRHAPAVNY